MIKNNSDPTLEFSTLGKTAGVRRPDQAWWTGKQFAELVPGFDEPKLRRLGLEKNPATGEPWIPKARAAKFEFRLTLMGVIAYLLHQLSQRDGLPAYFDSMQHMQDSALATPKKFMAWALENGAGEARLGGSRINPRPILALLNRIGESVATGTITGLDGMEQWDKDTEIAKKTEQDRFKVERENALADRRIFDLNEVEERVRLGIASKIRDGLHSIEKKYSRLKKMNPEIAAEICTKDIPALRARITESIKENDQQNRKN